MIVDVVFDCVVVDAVEIVDKVLVEEEFGIVVVVVEESVFNSSLFAVVTLAEEDVVVIFILLFRVLLNVDAKEVVVWVTTAVNFVNNYVCLVLFVLKLTCNTRLPNV